MIQSKQTPPDTDEVERASNEYDRLREMLHVHISEFADEHDLPFGTLSLLLIDLGVSSHMFNYLVSVRKPSAFGLKMELDRLGSEIEHFLRGSKRDADDFVRDSKELIQEAQRQAEAQDAEAQEAEAQDAEDQDAEAKDEDQATPRKR